MLVAQGQQPMNCSLRFAATADLLVSRYNSQAANVQTHAVLPQNHCAARTIIATDWQYALQYLMTYPSGTDPRLRQMAKLESAVPCCPDDKQMPGHMCLNFRQCEWNKHHGPNPDRAAGCIVSICIPAYCRQLSQFKFFLVRLHAIS